MNQMQVNDMDTLSEADNTTVVGSWPREGPSTSKPVLSKGKETVSEFVSQPDYLAENRSFFVNISKDGMVAALQKLDTQLRNVECKVLISDSSTDRRLQSARPGILSRKVRFTRFCVPLQY
jgi:hypothetical protein